MHDKGMPWVRFECMGKSGEERVQVVRAPDNNGRGRLVKRVYLANVESNRGRGRPQRRGRDEVKELLMGEG